MNIKLNRFFYLIGSFIIGSFLVILGALSIILPWSKSLETMLLGIIQEHYYVFSLFGLVLLLVGAFIITTLFFSTRRHYLIIRSGDHPIEIDENIVHQYLAAYWKEQFPQSDVSYHLEFNKETLQIVATLPFLPMNEQKSFLEKIQQDFSYLFSQLLGYPNDVHLMATFLPENHST